MALEQTLSIIKPDAVRKKVVGEILSRIEESGLKIVAAKMVFMALAQAQEFYAIHRQRPFFKDLTTFMSSGPVLVAVLEGEDAIGRYRALMGATNPKDAAPGTIRADFADSIDHNAVHGSDAAETAKHEIPFFFTQEEIFSR